MSKAQEYIYSFGAFGKTPGLARINALLKLLGEPQDSLRFIHVAGTNGKGSTCTYISNILRLAGYKTGLYLSPYVLDFRERFQINGEMIAEDELDSLCDTVRAAADKLPRELLPTQFDLITAIAFLYYKAHRCDVVVLETGLGGLYDSTNCIKSPLCSVITSISYDHTAVLGDTMEKIAAQKAGIIKDGCPTAAYPKLPDSALRVICGTAKVKNSAVTVPDLEKLHVKDNGIYGSDVKYGELEFSLKLCGAFQPLNAVTAVEAVRLSGLSVSRENITEGLSSTVFPARCEVLRREPLVLLDGGHNPDGILQLSGFIKSNVKTPAVAVMGMMADKDVESSLGTIAPLFYKIFCVKPQNPRSMSANGLAAVGSKFTECIPCESVKEGIIKALAENNSTVICGSLYLASEARSILIKEIL